MDSGTRQKIPSVWLDFGYFPVFYSAVWMESPAVFVGVQWLPCLSGITLSQNQVYPYSGGSALLSAVFVKSVGEISEDIESEGRQNKILEKTDS